MYMSILPILPHQGLIRIVKEKFFTIKTLYHDTHNPHRDCLAD